MQPVEGPAPLLVLASASPRRRELLARLGLPFSVFPVATPERVRRGLGSRALAEALALEKARATLARLRPAWKAAKAPRGWVLGADTLVWLAGAPLGKPAGPRQAADMLARLSGRAHEVVTGLALVPLHGGEPLLAAESTKVFFRKLSKAEITDYVHSGGPLDKAGAYGIQEEAGSFVERIEGCYFNVMGLPLARTRELLVKAGLLQ